MEKENLDNLFRESLDEFSASPDPRVWDRIQASLDKKTKRRRRAIPLWWQLGGAAAAAALLLYLLIPQGEIESPLDTDPLTNDPAKISVKQEPNMDSVESGAADREVQLTDSETPEPGIQVQLPSQGAVNNSRSESQIASGENSSESAKRTDRPSDPGTALATQKEAEKRPLEAVEKEILPTISDALAVVPKEAAEDTSTPNRTEDSQAAELAEAAQKEALRELLPGQDEEALIQKENTEGKWAIGPSVAPVYFNGLGNGSPIDQSFVSNEKSGSFNMSYGLQVSYQLNKRLQLRSGLHKVDFGYNTNDIVFSSSLQASSASEIRNVDFAPASEYLVVNSRNALPAKADSGFRTEIAARNTSREGTMVQEFGYLEVPLEVNYTLIDRTLGVHLISGISSLFLVDNNVSLESETGTTEVGQANNLNDVNFSANFGLGVQYKVNEKINLQVEPLLKYQLNTFSNTAGNFRPYSIGVYSGIRFKF